MVGWRGRGSGGLKGVARNILASPRAPSCVLNHFPVDSAVCNPIIGVSPPGKLLFYSRTTRAPGVYRDIPCLPSPRPVLVSPPPTLFYSLPSSPFDRRRLRCSSKSIFFFFPPPRPFSSSPPLPLSFPSFQEEERILEEKSSPVSLW